jgi:uncharacterized protein YjbI with pentapeptide repeats
MHSTNISEGSMVGAILHNTGLSGANLKAVDFSRAALNGADFGGSILDNAVFADATLEQTSFNGAQLLATEFARADFAEPTSSDETEGTDQYAVAFNGASYNDDTTWPSGFAPPLSAIHQAR